MSDDLQYMLAPDVSIRQLAGGLHALATGMDTLLEKITALECEMRDIKAYVLATNPRSKELSHEGHPARSTSHTPKHSAAKRGTSCTS